MKIDMKSLVLGALLGGVIVFSIAAAGSNKSADILRVRRLIVVDEKGVDRIVIGAPVPDPQIMGKRLHRRSPGTGVQINDANGNERGAVGMLDDGSFALGIDDELGRERAHMFFIPKRGAGLLLQGENGREHISLSIPAEGAQPAKPELEITDQVGNSMVTLPPAK